MMKRSERLSRNEIKERVGKATQDMTEKEHLLEDDVADIETIRKTLENLEGGTSEGFEQIEEAIENAENVTADAFEKEDENLEQIQNESQEFGTEIQDTQQKTESDLGKISNASAEFKTEEPNRDFLQAKEEALRDIDLLKEQDEQERHAREKSDAIQEKLRSRIQKNERN